MPYGLHVTQALNAPISILTQMTFVRSRSHRNRNFDMCVSGVCSSHGSTECHFWGGGLRVSVHTPPCGQAGPSVSLAPRPTAPALALSPAGSCQLGYAAKRKSTLTERAGAAGLDRRRARTCMGSDELAAGGTSRTSRRYAVEPWRPGHYLSVIKAHSPIHDESLMTGRAVRLHQPTATRRSRSSAVEIAAAK